MLTIAICDDEKKFLIQERRLITDYFSRRNYICCVNEFLSGEDLLASEYEIQKYNIIFLDVNMGELDGLETAKRIREQNKDVILVFVTALVKYCPEGYKVDAIRYLIKGEVNFEYEMHECLDAVCIKLQIENWKHQFQFREGELQLGAKDIIYIASNLRQISFNLTRPKGIYTMYEKLDVMDNLLADRGFIRIHKSFLVNQFYIKRVCRYEVELYNGERLAIAKPRYIDVQNKYLAFKGGL